MKEEFLKRFSESQRYRWRFYSLAVRAHFFGWVGLAAVGSLFGWRWMIDAVPPVSQATTFIGVALVLWTEHRFLVRYLAGRYPEQWGPGSVFAADPLAGRSRMTKEVLFGQQLAADDYVKDFRAGRLVLFRVLLLNLFSWLGIILAAHIIWALIARSVPR